MEELSRLWFDLYEPNIVEKNIEVLEQHVKTLFEDITNESVKRRADLQAEVDRKFTPSLFVVLPPYTYPPSLARLTQFPFS